MRDIGVFNKALVGKCVWRFLMEKESLWGRVVRSRYGFLDKEGSGEG